MAMVPFGQSPELAARRCLLSSSIGRGGGSAMLETQSWNRTASDALWSGAWAAVASAVVLSWRGHREADDAAAPINGPSQWFWGRTAPSARGFSVKHTVVGYLTHHFAATFWALWFERVRERVGHPAAVALG